MFDAHPHDEHSTYAFDRDKRPYRVTPAPVRTESPRATATRQVTLIDVVYAVIVIASGIAFLNYASGAYFLGVDWQLAERGGQLGDFLKPLRGGLGIPTIGVYRTLYKLIGFDSYTPWHLVVIACLLVLSVALYLVLRRRTGPLIAGVVAVYFLWYPHTAFIPSDLGFILSAIAAVAAAYALQHDDRNADVGLLGAILFALVSSSAGVAVLAAAIVYAACTRATPRRWVVIVVPLLASLIWFVKYDRHDWRVAPAGRLAGGDLVTRVVDGIRASFDGLGFANKYLGALLLVLFVLHLGWRLLQGLAAATNAIAWSAALVVWWGWCAVSFGSTIATNAMPFVAVGGVFIVLAMVPPTKLTLPRLTRSPVAALAVLLAAAVFVAANHGAIVDQADARSAETPATKQAMVIGGLNVLLVPDATRLGPALGYLTAQQYRRLIDQYGAPKGVSETNPDFALARGAGYKLALFNGKPQCRKPVNRVLAAPGSLVVIVAGNAPARVDLRRFDRTGVVIGTVPAHSGATMQLLSDPSTHKWTVNAPGACMTAVPPKPAASTQKP